MAQKHKVTGYDEYVAVIDNLSKTTKATINVYFTGAKDAAGKSWCPDCNDGKKCFAYIFLTLFTD